MGHRHPVAMLSASLIAVSMMRVCTLRYQTGTQYSAVEYTRAKTAALVPHPDSASRLIKAMHEVSFPHSDSRFRWYVRELSSFSPRYVGIWVKNRHFPSSVKLSL